MLKKKKGQSGNAVQYMTRNQAIKKLQLKLSEFRRLCILKGIHPREPKKKVQGAHKTYYHAKDIAFLLHEPLLAKVRELAVHEKKVRRAAAKSNRERAAQLASRRPTYRLDHLVRERYPSFVDALRDLDDPLTMIHLFAVLPSSATHGIPVARVHLARRLALEWQAWVVRSSSLRKCFVSVKGYYYQAEVQGQAVTWLVPHQLSQVLPPDVDFKVMLTFLELYQTTLQFVMYKLYTSSGLRYPPMLDPRLEEAAAGLQAVMADLAGSGGSAARLVGGSATEAAAEETEEERGVNPEAARRLGGLAHKVRQLEREIEGMEAAPPEEEAEGSEGGSEDEDEDFDIDSGSEQEEEEEEEEGEEEEEEGSDDPEAAADPADSDLPLPAASTAPQAPADPATVALTGGAVDVDADDDAALCASLFRGLTFFLGREVPREQLLLVIRAFGGEAGWDGEGSPVAENDERIGYHVVDRPQQGHKFLSRQYVQPQWVFDCANARVLVRTEIYAPGRAPPPHLSPFVDAEQEGYMPEYGREVAALQEAARAVRRRHAGAALEDTFLADDAAAAGAEPSAEEEMAAAERRYAAELAKELGASAEAAAKAEAAETKEPAQEAAKGGVDDEAALKDVMMTRKVKRAYQRATKEQAAKKARVEVLEQRAARVTTRSAK